MHEGPLARRPCVSPDLGREDGPLKPAPDKGSRGTGSANQLGSGRQRNGPPVPWRQGLESPLLLSPGASNTDTSLPSDDLEAIAETTEGNPSSSGTSGAPT
jgi:hypothetical protein